jgi:hypothetical protein
MATAVEAAIAEIDERLATFAPQHEGLRDYASLNIQPHTQEVVHTMIVKYDQRKALLDTAKAALQELMDDGHPDISTQEVESAVFDDINANALTIEAARKLFSSGAATALSLGSGKVEPK